MVNETKGIDEGGHSCVSFYFFNPWHQYELYDGLHTTDSYQSVMTIFRASILNLNTVHANIGIEQPLRYFRLA